MGGAEVQLARPLADPFHPDNATTPVPDTNIALLAKSEIPAYKCPSSMNTAQTAWSFATASYAGNHGRTTAWGFFDNDGLLRRMGQIPDGLSYTIAVSEAGAVGSWSTGVRSAWGSGSVQQPQWIGSPQGFWHANLKHINEQNERCVPNLGDTAGFSSGHPGGLHALAGDGAVHWLSEQTAPAIWVSLGTVQPYMNYSFNAGHTRFVATLEEHWLQNPTNSVLWNEVQGQWPSK